MFKHQSTTKESQVKRKLPNKLVAGFAALVVTTLITASGFAAATSSGQNTSSSGYGGGNVGTNLNLNLNNSNNNIITVIVNIFN